MLKFAAFQVEAAVLIPKGASRARVRRIARRHEFKYDVRPGFLYVKSRAISSRTNDNYDEFPAEEIASEEPGKGYQTFVGKPVFVNHVNDNHRRARGVIIDAVLHRDTLADGSPDTWVEVLMEIDAVRFPKLAKAILDKRIDRTSMGVDVERSQCSACGNWATSPAEYCQHIPRMKGKKMRKRGDDGSLTDHLIRETCYGLSFFENSVLVEPPADPTAHFLGVDDSGVKKAASKTAAYMPEEHREITRSNPELGSWKVKHSIDGGTHPVDDNPVAQMALRAGQGRAIHYFHPGHGYGVETSDGPILDTDGSRYHATPEGAIAAQWNHEKATGQIFHPLFLDQNDSTKASPAGEGYYPEREKAMQDMHGWRSENDKGYQADLMHDRLTLPMRPDAPRMSDEARDYLDSNPTGPTKYSSLMAHFASLDDDPSNHLFKGEPGGKCYCGDEEAYHPHPSAGQWARCSTCGKDMSHHLHDEGRYEHLKHQESLPPGHSQMMMEHIFGEYGQDYGVDNPAPSKHDTEKALAEQMKGLGGDDAEWLLDQQEGKPSKYSSLMTHFASWSPTDLSQEQKDYYASPDPDVREYMGQSYANEPRNGAVMWRGEIRHKDDLERPPSVGMHWSTNPDRILVPGVEAPEDHHHVIWEARLHDAPNQTVPKSNPMWHDPVLKPIPEEQEIRLSPGSHVNVERAFVHRPAEGQPRYPNHWPNPLETPTETHDWTSHSVNAPVEVGAGPKSPYPKEWLEKSSLLTHFAAQDGSLYHGTVEESARAIERTGLNPHSYLAEDDYDAMDYARLGAGCHSWADAHGGLPEDCPHEDHGKPVVLRVDAREGEDYEPEGDFAVTHRRIEPSRIQRHASKDGGPSVSGVVLKAADTGRVLMIQRSHKDESDPARGTWEFPGGHHEEGDTTSLHAGIREWEEEVGQPFPEGGTVAHTWRSPNGIYQGHVVVIPEESAVSLKDGRVTVNPDDPDGDDHEQAAWWDPKHAEKNPALRKEVKKAPWNDLRKAAGRHRADDGDTERWHECDQGHHHWGSAGAAGALIRHTDEDGTTRYLLQHRAPWVQEGGTWGIPAGALHHGEDSVEGAMRESAEELGRLPELHHVGTHTDDHGGWAFHTHVFDTPSRWEPDPNNSETGTGGFRWATADEAQSLPLHSGFAKTFPTLQKMTGTSQKRASRQVGQRHVWPVRVLAHDRATGKIVGHVGSSSDRETTADINHPTLPYAQVSRRQYPFRLCEPHLDGLRGQIKGHNEQATSHPHKYSVDTHTWPLNPTDVNDISSCDACTISGVNDIFKQGSEEERIPISDEDRALYEQIANHSQHRMEQWQHAERRVVDLNDPVDLRQHMIESHDFTDGDFWRNSHAKDHPALPASSDVDRPLSHKEIRALHDHDHSTGDYAGTTLGDSHFHQAMRKTADEDQCPYCAGDSLMSGGGYTCEEGHHWHPHEPAAQRYHDDDSPERGQIQSLPKTAASDLTRHEVLASDIQQGDFLDISGKVRVHQTRTANGQTTLAYKVRGSKAPGIHIHPEDKSIFVWRREAFRRTAAFLGKGDAVWSKPSGEHPVNAPRTEENPHGVDPADGPFHLTRHPETRAHQLVDRQNRLMWSAAGSDGSGSEYHAPDYMADTFHELNQKGGHHSPLPYETDELLQKPTGERDEIGKELFRRERGIGEHAPAFEHSTTDPRQADLESRPAPRKHAPEGHSPEDEWHGPYEVVQHPETDKYHVVDNQGRHADHWARARRGHDDVLQAQDARDTVDRRTQSKEKAKKMVDDLYEGFAQIVDPGSTPESRQSDRHIQSMNELASRYEGGTHHPLTPGRFGHDDEEHEGDENGQPYYEVKDPGGSGYTARDYGGQRVHIHHEGLPKDSSQVDSVDPDGSTPGSWSEKGTKPVGFGHEELHAELQHWIHGDPNEPEDERYAPGKDYARAMPQIEQWQKRKGYRG